MPSISMEIYFISSATGPEKAVPQKFRAWVPQWGAPLATQASVAAASCRSRSSQLGSAKGREGERGFRKWCRYLDLPLARPRRERYHGERLLREACMAHDAL
jgi:hypothetical protein